jgi:uncharacterized protein YqeY
MADDLKQRIDADVKTAMRARDRERLGVLRLVTAAVKQREVDERILLDDTAVLAVLDKMLKQRRDSLAQFRQAGREDLANQEAFEIEVIVTATGAAGMGDMGKVMGYLRPKVQGRADLGALSTSVKGRLGA